MAFTKVAWLDAAASTQTSSSEDVTGVRTYTLQADVTGTPSGFGLSLEGSIDGTNWFTLISLSGTDRFNWVADRPVKHARLNLHTLSGGSSPTVTASVVAV